MKVEPVSSNIVKNIKGSGRGIHTTNIPERLFLSLRVDEFETQMSVVEFRVL